MQQQAPLPTPAKVATNQKNHGNVSSWQASGSSPSKAVAPVQMSNNTPSRSKSSAEDDLFWGPSEHSKQDKRQYVLQWLLQPNYFSCCFLDVTAPFIKLN